MLPSHTTNNLPEMPRSNSESDGESHLASDKRIGLSQQLDFFIGQLGVVNIFSIPFLEINKRAVSDRISDIRFGSSGIQMFRIAAKAISASVADICALGGLAICKNERGSVGWKCSHIFTTAVKAKLRIMRLGDSIPRPALVRFASLYLWPKSFLRAFFVNRLPEDIHSSAVGFNVKHERFVTYTPVGAQG